MPPERMEDISVGPMLNCFEQCEPNTSFVRIYERVSHREVLHGVSLHIHKGHKERSEKNFFNQVRAFLS